MLMFGFGRSWKFCEEELAWNPLGLEAEELSQEEGEGKDRHLPLDDFLFN